MGEAKLKNTKKIKLVFEKFQIYLQVRHLQKAYRIAQKYDKDAGLSFLDRTPSRTPLGARHLFEAAFAPDEESWLTHLNEWGRTANLPNIQLTKDGGHRFSRIKFELFAPVDSPDLVTIIIPCFNAENDIEQAVRSIQQQTWQNIEIIVVNDKSSDNTGTILNRLAAKDQRIKVLHNIVNVGPYASKNRALALAKGRYVTGHDSDDIALPNRIELQIRSLTSSSGAKATVGNMLKISTDGKIKLIRPRPRLTWDGVTKLCSISMMCETKTFRELFGAWDSVRFGADSEMIARMKRVLGKKFVRDRQILMICQDRESSLSNNNITGTRVGLSPVRRSYRQNYNAWQRKADSQEMILSFPHYPRRFEAPELMVVPAEDIIRNIRDDIF